MPNHTQAVWQEEFLDVVNEQDEVVGQASFVEAHEQKLLHRFCRIIMLDGNGDWILQRRAFDIRVEPDAMFDCHGGHVRAGEDYLTAAVREAAEEVGAEISPSDLTPIGPIRYQKFHENMIGQAFLLKTAAAASLDQREVVDLVTLSLAEIELLMNKLPYLFTPQFHSSFNAYQKYQQEQTT